VIHTWTRFWTRPDGSVSLGDQGFLVGPAEDHLFAAPSPDLWTFEESRQQLSTCSRLVWRVARSV
jgi:hypothetical protein